MLLGDRASRACSVSDNRKHVATLRRDTQPEAVFTEVAIAVIEPDTAVVLCRILKHGILTGEAVLHQLATIGIEGVDQYVVEDDSDLHDDQ